MFEGMVLMFVVCDSSGCPQASGKWCIVASTLEDVQQMGQYVAADPGQGVTFHCELLFEGRGWGEADEC